MDDVYVVLFSAASGAATLIPLDDDGLEDPEQPAEYLGGDDLVEAVEALEPENPRWVWADTGAQYSWLLSRGVRVDRCHDLRLTRAILRASTLSANTRLATSPPGEWDAAAPLVALGGGLPDVVGAGSADGPVPFDFDRLPTTEAGADAGAGPVADDAAATVAELALQLDAIRTSAEPNRLRLLIAAESAGALVAAEMSHAGLPWREDLHDRLLTELLGPQPSAGQRPERLERLVAVIRSALDAPQLNPDSPHDLLRALRGAGLAVTTTRSWELRSIEHPVIAPLLEYKKLARLATANGWSWMASWVSGGRFHPDYVPGGVVSGRWATRGGGALQLPKQVRRAVTADDGWKLVVADAAQLEPRILAGISSDTVMAAAGRGTDLYAGIVASGAVETRAQAKVAMLGAMYGATTGESGRLLPRLNRAFPTALSYVENAARAGERGEVVTSRLGRSAPRPAEQWWETQALAAEGAPDERVQQQARREARDWGRFTRNFVVQASAADWALCWLADLRRRLSALAPGGDAVSAGGGGDAAASGAASGGGSDGRAADAFYGAAATNAADRGAAEGGATAVGASDGGVTGGGLDGRAAGAAYGAAATGAVYGGAVYGGAVGGLATATGVTDGVQHPAAAATGGAAAAAGAGATSSANVTRATERVADPSSTAAAATEADAGSAVAELSPAELEAARIAAIEAEIAERERRKAADSPFKAVDPVAAMAERLAELQTAGRSVRVVGAAPSAPASPQSDPSPPPALGAPSSAAAPSDTASSGAPPSDAAPNAAPPRGPVQRGALPSSTARNGIAPSNAAPTRAAPRAAVPTRAAPRGAVPSGAAPGGGAPGLPSPSSEVPSDGARAEAAPSRSAASTAPTAIADRRTHDSPAAPNVLRGSAEGSGRAATAEPRTDDTTDRPVKTGAAVSGGRIPHDASTASNRGIASPDAFVPGRAAAPFGYAPHLVFFLHDEVIVHTPAGLADEVADAIRASAAAATRLLFGRFPLDVPLDISIVDSYADAD